MSNCLYILLGSFLTIIGTFITDYVRNKRSDRIYVLRKREKVYLEANKLVYEMVQLISPCLTKAEAAELSLYIKKQRETFQYEFIVYASKEVRNLFLDLISVPDKVESLSGNNERDIEEERTTICHKFKFCDAEKFLDLIRKELGTYEYCKTGSESMFCFKCNLCTWLKNKLS